MRKLLTAATFFFTFSAALQAQTANWFVSFQTGTGWGGPKGSIKKTLIKNSFNQTSYFNFLGLSGKIAYPISSSGVPALLKVGKKVKGNKSIYLLGGLTGNGEVSGFRNEGYSDFLGLFGSSVGMHVRINYNVYQLGAGFEHTLPNTKIKLGYGPALYLFNYKHSNDVEGGSNNSLVPGASFTGRVPLGKEKRRIGVELVADVNLAPPAKMKTLHYSFNDGTAEKTVALIPQSNVSMVQGMAGIALTFRHR